MSVITSLVKNTDWQDLRIGLMVTRRFWNVLLDIISYEARFVNNDRFLGQGIVTR